MGSALWDVLEGVPDRRAASGRRHPLAAVLAITLAAMLAGRTSLAGIARWGRRLDEGALRALGISRPRAPCHATYHDVFRDLDVAALEAGLAAWVRGAGAPGRRGGGGAPASSATSRSTASGCAAAGRAKAPGCICWPPSATACGA